MIRRQNTMRPRSSLENLPLQTHSEDFNQSLISTASSNISNDYQTKDPARDKQKYLITAIVFGVIGIVSLISVFFFI